MKLKLLIIFCPLFEFAYTQNTNDKDQFFVFDKNWKAADMKKAGEIPAVFYGAG